MRHPGIEPGTHGLTCHTRFHEPFPARRLDRARRTSKVVVWTISWPFPARPGGRRAGCSWPLRTPAVSTARRGLSLLPRPELVEGRVCRRPRLPRAGCLLVAQSRLLFKAVAACHRCGEPGSQGVPAYRNRHGPGFPGPAPDEVRCSTDWA